MDFIRREAYPCRCIWRKRLRPCSEIRHCLPNLNAGSSRESIQRRMVFWLTRSRSATSAIVSNGPAVSSGGKGLDMAITLVNWGRGFQGLRGVWATDEPRRDRTASRAAWRAKRCTSDFNSGWGVASVTCSVSSFRRGTERRCRKSDRPIFPVLPMDEMHLE